MLATTPDPPYTAVIFTAMRTEGDNGYAAMAARMDALASEQPGYLGIESVRSSGGLGITVSYWVNDSAARAWKGIAEHVEAQRMGRERWYDSYSLRVATVQRDYDFGRD